MAWRISTPMRAGCRGRYGTPGLVVSARGARRLLEAAAPFRRCLFAIDEFLPYLYNPEGHPRRGEHDLSQAYAHDRSSLGCVLTRRWRCVCQRRSRLLSGRRRRRRRSWRCATAGRRCWRRTRPAPPTSTKTDKGLLHSKAAAQHSERVGDFNSFGADLRFGPRGDYPSRHHPLLLPSRRFHTRCARHQNLVGTCVKLISPTRSIIPHVAMPVNDTDIAGILRRMQPR